MFRHAVRRLPRSSSSASLRRRFSTATTTSSAFESLPKTPLANTKPRPPIPSATPYPSELPNKEIVRKNTEAMMWQRQFQFVSHQARRRLEVVGPISSNSSYHTRASLLSAQLPSLQTQCTNISRPLFQYMQQLGFTNSRTLLADSTDAAPVASPLSPALQLGTGKPEDEKVVVKREKVQAVLKGIKESPKKVNLVAELIRGMHVRDALLQLQVTVKRAAKTVYKVIHAARANAVHNHGLDPDRLLVAEAFVGKGIYLKRISYHSKGRSGIMTIPSCRLTVIVRETTPEEEARIARLRVHTFKKRSKYEKRLVPFKLIEVTPRWNRRSKDQRQTSDNVAAAR